MQEPAGAGATCGKDRRDEAFAEIVADPAPMLYRLPDELGWPEPATLEVVSVALDAVRLSALGGGETALVLGAGMIGLLAAEAARVGRCGRVPIRDVDVTRLERAKRSGSTRRAR